MLPATALEPWVETLRELFDPNIVFHVPGRSQIAGDYRGIDETFGFFGKLVELSGGTFKIERHTVLADDEANLRELGRARRARFRRPYSASGPRLGVRSRSECG